MGCSKRNRPANKRLPANKSDKVAVSSKKPKGMKKVVEKFPKKKTAMVIKMVANKNQDTYEEGWKVL